MKILLFSRYGRLGASSRLRSYQYLPYLRENGIQVTVAPFFEDEYLKNFYIRRQKQISVVVLNAYFQRVLLLPDIRRFQLLWIEKEIIPWFPSFVERILSRLGIPYFVDYDDAVFHRYDMHPQRLVRLILGNKIDHVMARAALVTVGNRYLASRAKKAGAKTIEYLPTVIDLERYGVKEGGDQSKIKIGWIGSPTTSGYLDLVQPALAEVCRGGNIRLILVGSGQMRLDGVPTEIRPWSEETEVQDIQDIDIGIMPMPDNPWTRGKCGYKLVQYMACGRPVVASDVGMNRDLVEHGVNGFLAKDMAGWIHALKVLQESAMLRKKMGACGRKKVERTYCIQRTAPRLLSHIYRIFQEKIPRRYG